MTRRLPSNDLTYPDGNALPETIDIIVYKQKQTVPPCREVVEQLDGLEQQILDAKKLLEQTESKVDELEFCIDQIEQVGQVEPVEQFSKPRKRRGKK